jgi:hypothetical protein
VGGEILEGRSIGGIGDCVFEVIWAGEHGGVSWIADLALLKSFFMLKNLGSTSNPRICRFRVLIIFPSFPGRRLFMCPVEDC